MFNINNKLQDNNISKEELLDNIEITNMQYQDVFFIARILHKNMGVNKPFDALLQLVDSKIDVENSVKLIDKRNGDIYGLLTFSQYKMSQGSPIYHYENAFARFMDKYNQINGFLFIIDVRLRGTNLDKKMLKYSLEYLNKYDFVWIAVDKELETHNYWKRLGFTTIFDIPQANFSVKILNNQVYLDIYQYIKKHNIDFKL